MQAPEPLLQRLATVPGMESGRRRLVLLLPQLGDFDSLEYAQALVPALHRALGLYAGLQVPGGPWPGLLLMCAGIGSPGTLAEVLRGYSGDRRAALRPFELATVRLRNMVEVLGAWRTYLLDGDDSLLYSYRDPGILGFSATMAEPLSFLAPYLSPSPAEPSAPSPGQP